MIGFIGAMSVEIDRLLADMTDREDRRIGLDIFTSGLLYGKEAVVVVCGPGKVNAALCTQSMILHYHPEWILNLGVAGAADPELSIGDMVIATAAVQHDMDTSPIGDPPGFVSKVGLIEFPCDPDLRQRLLEAASSLPAGKVVEGVIATGDLFVNQAEITRRIRERFGAAAVEMEGAAVAHACYVHQVPCGILRSISDGANSDSDMDYPTFTNLAAEHAQYVVEALLVGEGE